MAVQHGPGLHAAFGDAEGEASDFGVVVVDALARDGLQPVDVTPTLDSEISQGLSRGNTGVTPRRNLVQAAEED